MIPYTYEVIESTPKGMLLRYTSEGRDPVLVGTHAPRPGESLDAIAWQYSPVVAWAAADAVGGVVPVGTTGSYTPPTEEPETLQTKKAKKAAEIAEWRYAKETKGIQIAGVKVRTDRESQATISGAYSSLRDGLIQSVDWKAANGTFVTLTLQEITAIAQAVAQHVQGSFTREKELLTELSSLQTIEAVEAMVVPWTEINGSMNVAVL